MFFPLIVIVVSLVLIECSLLIWDGDKGGDKLYENIELFWGLLNFGIFIKYLFAI